MKPYKRYLPFLQGKEANKDGDGWYDNPYKKDGTEKEESDRKDWMLGYNQFDLALEQAHVRSK